MYITITIKFIILNIVFTFKIFHDVAGSSQDSLGPIKATPAMLRCSKIMQLQREIHPTILLSLEGIVDQVCILFFRHSMCISLFEFE